MSVQRHICVDISQFIGWRLSHPTGIQRVICEFILQLLRQGRQFSLCACDKNGDVWTIGYSSLPPLLKEYAIKSGRDALRYLQSMSSRIMEECIRGDVLYLNFDATWQTNLLASFESRYKSGSLELVSMVYDVIPCLQPQWSTPFEAQIFSYWADKVLQISDRVLTISQFSEAEIIRYCKKRNIKHPRIDIVRLGDLADNLLDSIDRPGALPRRPISGSFFLLVGSLVPRKNHRLVYETWSLLLEMGFKDIPSVVVAGNISHPHMKGFCYEVLHSPEISKYFFFVNSPGDWELDWYYKNCLATIYPSVYEGWGLPVAESLCYGKITFALNKSSIPEINSDLTSFIESNTPQGLAAAILKFLNNEEWRALQEDKIRTTFRPRRWQESAIQILNLLDAG